MATDPSSAGWRARLQLHYRLDDTGRTVSHDRHQGPLRVLQRLYPEGPRVCHHVLVHPPGGIVGGDVLEIEAQLEAGSHALLTTPGATRFYRSGGPLARQQAQAVLAPGARLEWVPMETIAYGGCHAHNQLRFELQGDAQMLGWDVLALGLPAADQPFDAGRFTQELCLPRLWLERGTIDAHDRALLDSPLGLDGRRALATAWFAAGQAMPAALRDPLLEAAREAIAGSELATHAGCSAVHPELVVLRVLAQRVEPALQLLMQVRSRWRRAAWNLGDCTPRVWRT